MERNNRAREKRRGSIARMLVVCPTATVFPIEDFCWFDTFLGVPNMHFSYSKRCLLVTRLYTTRKTKTNFIFLNNCNVRFVK